LGVRAGGRHLSLTDRQKAQCGGGGGGGGGAVSMASSTRPLQQQPPSPDNGMGGRPG
jgi:hypothetical protein